MISFHFSNNNLQVLQVKVSHGVLVGVNFHVLVLSCLLSIYGGNIQFMFILELL